MKEVEGRVLSEAAFNIINILSRSGWDGHVVGISEDSSMCLCYEKGDVLAQIERFVWSGEDEDLINGEYFVVWTKDWPDNVQPLSCKLDLDSVFGGKDDFGNRERYLDFWAEQEPNLYCRLYYENNPRIETTKE